MTVPTTEIAEGTATRVTARVVAEAAERLSAPSTVVSLSLIHI